MSSDLFNTDTIADFSEGSSTFEGTIDNQISLGGQLADDLATVTNDAKTTCGSLVGSLSTRLTDTGSSLTTSNDRVEALTTRLQSVASVANKLYTKASDAKRELNALKGTCTPST